ncbi:histidine decarboxylase, pyruvoyl type [Patescibacteria group bacterium]|nr:histidine decarboxylase, pyruvoyl type [Patescibacteria group bacterium]
MFNIKDNLINSIGPHDNFCDGYGVKGSSGNSYILGTVLAVGKVKSCFKTENSKILDEINAFDKAEVTNTNIGQINMINVSSFCGPQGIILGYDFLSPTNIDKYLISNFSTSRLRVYNIDPLVNSTRELIGTLADKHFPFLPGAHVPCAGRNIEKDKPGTLYCGIAIGIPVERENAACLIMEDVGYMRSRKNNFDETKIISNLIDSVTTIGINQGVAYPKIFTGIKYIEIGTDEVGCALVRAPYLVLARKALIDIDEMISCNLETWCKYKINK